MLNFFEQPYTLLITAILVSFVMLMLRRIFPKKRHWWQWLVPVLFVAAAFGMDSLVQTDLEKINAVINTGVTAVEKENCDAIEAIITDNYRDSYHNTKDALIFHCRARLSEPLIEKNIKRILSIEVTPPKAIAIFTVRIVFDKKSSVSDFTSQMMTKVQLNLYKEKDNNWLISRIEILEINMRPVNWQHIGSY